MLSAKEALRITEESTPLTEKLEALGESIKKRAGLGRRECRTGYDHQAHTDLWINGGYSQTNEWKDAKKILESAGYKVSFYYQELQLVDMYTLIEW